MSIVHSKISQFGITFQVRKCSTPEKEKNIQCNLVIINRFLSPFFLTNDRILLFRVSKWRIQIGLVLSSNLIFILYQGYLLNYLILYYSEIPMYVQYLYVYWILYLIEVVQLKKKRIYVPICM